MFMRLFVILSSILLGVSYASAEWNRKIALSDSCSDMPAGEYTYDDKGWAQLKSEHEKYKIDHLNIKNSIMDNSGIRDSLLSRVDEALLEADKHRKEKNEGLALDREKEGAEDVATLLSRREQWAKYDNSYYTMLKNTKAILCDQRCYKGNSIIEDSKVLAYCQEVKKVRTTIKDDFNRMSHTSVIYGTTKKYDMKRLVRVAAMKPKALKKYSPPAKWVK